MLFLAFHPQFFSNTMLAHFAFGQKEDFGLGNRFLLLSYTLFLFPGSLFAFSKKGGKEEKCSNEEEGLSAQSRAISEKEI